MLKAAPVFAQIDEVEPPRDDRDVGVGSIGGHSWLSASGGRSTTFVA